MITGRRLTKAHSSRIRFMFLIGVPTRRQTQGTVLTVSSKRPIIIIRRLVKKIDSTNDSTRNGTLLLLALLLIQLLLHPSSTSFQPSCTDTHHSDLRTSDLRTINSPTMPSSFQFIGGINTSSTTLNSPIPQQVRPIVSILLSVCQATRG